MDQPTKYAVLVLFFVACAGITGLFAAGATASWREGFEGLKFWAASIGVTVLISVVLAAVLVPFGLT